MGTGLGLAAPGGTVPASLGTTVETYSLQHCDPPTWRAVHTGGRRQRHPLSSPILLTGLPSQELRLERKLGTCPCCSYHHIKSLPPLPSGHEKSGQRLRAVAGTDNEPGLSAANDILKITNCSVKYSPFSSQL